MSKRKDETAEEYLVRHRKQEQQRRELPEIRDRTRAYKQTDAYKARHATAERERRQTKQAKAYDREYRRTYRANNREKLRAYSREFAQRRRAKLKKLGVVDPWNTPEQQRIARRLNPARYAGYHRKQNYGLSQSEQDALFTTQFGLCANLSCQVNLVLLGRKGDSVRQLDHDHDTGKVRGWLCSACNGALGRLESVLRGRPTAERLRGLADYMEKHTTESVLPIS